jgi:hypothetical protein
MTGFHKYSEIFIHRAKELLEKEDLKNNPEYHEVLKNHLFGLKGPKQLDRKLTPSDVFFSKLATGFREIYDSYYSLLDIEVYIRRFPYPNTKVSKTRYLAYHMENYLNEVYMLKERLISYCTVVGRLYRNDHTLRDPKKAMKDLSGIVQKSLKAITDTRGTHVHSARLTDEDLDRLSSLGLINRAPNEIPLLKTVYESAFRNTRKKYGVAIKRNNEEIRKILNAYFEVIYAIVADEKGDVRYPHLKTA